MIAALDLDSITLDPAYQPPANMVEPGSTSAFNTDWPAKARPKQRFRPLDSDQQSEAVTLTDLLVTVFDPDHALAQELSEKVKRTQADLQAYRVRIDALRAKAELDGYGLNRASERDLWHFIRSEPFIRKGNLVLMDNGNLRAIWKGEHGTHIGLQFLGNRVVQYVIFKRRAAAGAISRVAGRDNFEGVNRQIAAFDLWPLIYA